MRPNTEGDVIHSGGTWGTLHQGGTFELRLEGKVHQGEVENSGAEHTARGKAQDVWEGADPVCGGDDGGRWSWRALSQTLEWPAVALRSVDFLQQTVETPRTGTVPGMLKAEVGSCNCIALVPTKPHSGQTVPEAHRALSCLRGLLLWFPEAGTRFHQPSNWLFLEGEAQMPLPLRDPPWPLFLSTSSASSYSFSHWPFTLFTCSLPPPLEWKPHESRARLSCSSFLPRMVTSTKQDVKYLPNELKN